MTRRQAKTIGLERERVRRQRLDLLKSQESALRGAEVTEGIRTQAPISSPAVGQRATGPADTTSSVDRSRGARLPGQHVVCGWCGSSVIVKSRGPIPKWCSPTCRHRAWEQGRAANSGRVALTVVDRYVTALPRSTPAWLDQLDALARQVRGEGLDLLLIHAALEVVLTAVENREERLSAAETW